MQEQIAIQKLLNEKIAESRSRNPSYSIRAFAKKAGLSPAALSEILRGKRKISPTLFSKVAVNLSFTPEEVAKVRVLFQESIPGVQAVKKPDERKQNVFKMIQLSADQYSLIAEWQHFAILSLLETKGAKSNPSWIAAKLGISRNVAGSSIQRLIRMGYLIEKNGKLSPFDGYLQTTDGEVNLPLRRAHSEDLHLAQKALEEVELELRDFTAVTMAIDVQKLKEAKEMIREFRTKLTTLLTNGNKNEVYKLCVQLFPLSKGEFK